MFGLLHSRGAMVRGAVVLCPPVGHEYMNAYSTFRELATQLELLGFAALRFDYRSTGDSFDRGSIVKNATGFVEDVRVAIEYLRNLGLDYVAVAGMRLGATFAAARCNLEPVNDLVLWDPCLSGRAFLREQHLLGLVAGRGRDQGSGELAVPGFSGSPEMLEEIASLNLWDQTGPLADRVLLLQRSGRAAGGKASGGLDGPNVDHREAIGQRELLDVESPRLTLPRAAISEIAAWLDDVAPRDPHDFHLPDSSEARVAIEVKRDFASDERDSAATTVMLKESAVVLGSPGLFAIKCEPANGASGPTCIFASVANEHRVGPGRLWVGLSRDLASVGFRCVRFDANGYGETPLRDATVGPQVYAASHIDDVVDAARALSPDDAHDVVLFGLCSSGYHILEASMTLAPRGICALNPSLLFHPPELDTTGTLDPRRRYCVPQTRLLTMARSRASLRRLRLRIPSLDWKVRGPLRALNWRVRNLFGTHKDLPTECFTNLVESGVDVLLICGPEDVQAFLHVQLSTDSAAPTTGRFQLQFMPSLNHTLFSAADRESVTAVILDHVVSRFGQSPMASPTS